MGLGPTPYKISAPKTPPRIAPSEIVSSVGVVPPELIGIAQVPVVNVPSSFDDAVRNSELNDKLGIDSDDIITKEIEKFPVKVEDPPAPEGSVLGSKVPETLSASSIPPTPFSSIEDVLPQTSNIANIAVGVVDLNSSDVNAFGGLGKVVEETTESSLADGEQQVLSQTERPIGSILGEKLPGGGVSQEAAVPAEETEPATDFGEAPPFDVGLLDGGDF
jgi:hypothetical protein